MFNTIISFFMGALLSVLFLGMLIKNIQPVKPMQIMEMMQECEFSLPRTQHCVLKAVPE